MVHRELTTTEQGVLDKYVTWLRSWGASPRTVKARHAVIRARIREWGLTGFTGDNITTFLADPDFGSEWTRSTYHGHLTCFCSWAHAAEHLAANPMVNVRKPQRPKSLPRPLAESEVARVLSVADGEVRDWIILALNAGLRASEIAKIRGEDVTADGIFVRGKGGTVVTLPCHPAISEVAQRYPRSGYWFPGSEDGHVRSGTISMTVGRFFRSIGIAGSIHRCRHVYGTRLLRNGVHIRTVQKLMRHANLDTTANYTAVDEDELRNAINKLPGVA